MSLESFSSLFLHRSVERYFLFPSHKMVATLQWSGIAEAFKAAPKTLAPDEIPTERPNLLICLEIFIASESFTRKTGLSCC